MATLHLHHPRFKVEIRRNKFYRIFEVDKHWNKTPVSDVFLGKDYHKNLPVNENHVYAYELQRVRYYSGTHELKE